MEVKRGWYFFNELGFEGVVTVARRVEFKLAIFGFNALIAFTVATV